MHKLLYGFIAMTLVACGSSSPTEQMSFRNSEYTKQVTNKLEERKISFNQLNDTTIVFSIKDSQAVTQIVSEVDTSLPMMYTIYGLERKIAFEKALARNGIHYEVYANNADGYSFLIESKDKNTVTKLFEQIK